MKPSMHLDPQSAKGISMCESRLGLAGSSFQFGKKSRIWKPQIMPISQIWRTRRDWELRRTRWGRTRRDRSNIAIARFLDMPRRIAQERYRV